MLMIQQSQNSLVRINTISVRMDRQSLIWLVERGSLPLSAMSVSSSRTVVMSRITGSNLTCEQEKMLKKLSRSLPTN